MCFQTISREIIFIRKLDKYLCWRYYCFLFNKEGFSKMSWWNSSYVESIFRLKCLATVVFYNRCISCLAAINQALPGLECFLREVLGSEGLSSDAEVKRQEFLKRLENIATPPSLPPRPPLLPPRLHFRNDSGSRVSEDESNSLYRNDGSDDPVAFASRQRELSRHYTYSRGYVGRKDLFGEDSPIYSPQVPAPSSNVSINDVWLFNVNFTSKIRLQKSSYPFHIQYLIILLKQQGFCEKLYS